MPSFQKYWVVPSYHTAKDGEAEALDLLSEILGGGIRSRIYQELVVKKGIASGAGASYSGTFLDDTSFSIYGAPRGEAGLDQVEAAIDAEIVRIIKDGVTDSELEKAKNRYVRSMIFARDNQSGMANIYGATLTTGGTVADVAEWPDRIRAVTADQVKAVAAKYLNPDRSVAGYLLPPAPVAELRSGSLQMMHAVSPDPASRRSSPPRFLSVVFLTLPAVMPARAAVTIQEVKSDSGITAWLVEDYSVPIISLRFAFRGGEHAGSGRQGRAGQSDDRAVRRGRRRSRQRCLPEPARRCRRRNALQRRPRHHLRLDAHARRPEGRGAATCCGWPSSSRASTRRRSTASAARSLPASSPTPAIPSTAAQLAWSKALYGDHPYSRQDEGTQATLASITADDLQGAAPADCSPATI